MKHTIIKQKTLNLLIIFAIFLVVVLVLINTVMLRDGINREIRVERTKAHCENISRQILDTSDYLTNEMRCFVVTQNIAYLNAYIEERYNSRTYEKAIEQLEQENLTEHEQELLLEIKRNSVLTMNDEIRAIKLIKEARGLKIEIPEDIDGYVLNVEDETMSKTEKSDKALEVLFNGDYTFEKETIRQEIESFQSTLQERFDQELRRAENYTDFVLILQTVMIILMCPILGFIFLLAYKYFTKPIVNYSKELEQYSDDDELEISDILRPEGSVEVKMFANRFNEVFQKMQQASRIKSEFLANMSHEIRTPLNTLTGYRFLLEQTELNKEQIEYVAAMKKADDLLQQNINNILDYSKLSLNGQQVERREFDLWKMLDNLESVFHYSAAEKGVRFRIRRGDNLPRVIKGDMGKLRQILANLIGNAIKFTNEGSVTVSVQAGIPAEYKEDCYEGIDAYGENDKRRFWLNIAVADTGVGIPREDWGRVFQPFEQVGTYSKRSQGGTGLGLAICRNLTNIMGGQIYLVERSVGSCFVVNIPVKRVKYSNELLVEADNAEVARLPQYVGKYVLLVDDNRINQKMEKKILEMFGIEVDSAYCGCEAVNKSMQERYDLIFMDIYMDDMDGFQALQNIRAKGINRETPVVALTADVEKKTIHRCVIEMNGYILKPLQMKNIIQVLHQVWGEASQFVRVGNVLDDGQFTIDGPNMAETKLQGSVSKAERELSLLVVELQEMFFSTHENDFRKLKGMCEDEDWLSLRKSIHKLKGASATAELYTISESLAEMEYTEKRQNKNELLSLVEQVNQEYYRLRNEYLRNRDIREGKTSTKYDIQFCLRQIQRLCYLLGKSDFEAFSLWGKRKDAIQFLLPKEFYLKLENYMKEMKVGEAYELLAGYLEGSDEDV